MSKKKRIQARNKIKKIARERRKKKNNVRNHEQ